MRPKYWLYTIPPRLRSLLRRAQADQELDDELRDHLERKTEEYLAHGMTQEDAHRRARLDLDGIEQTKEKCRDTRKVNWIQDLVQDFRYGLGVLRKSPSFTAVVILTLALGIGASTVIFSVVNGVLLRPLPYPNHDRLVRIGETHPRNGCGFCGTLGNVTYANFNDLERAATTVGNIAAFRQWLFNLTGEGEPEQVPGALVSGNFFAAFGSQPILGRVITPEEDAPGADNHVAVLSYALWQRRFGADPRIIGKTLRINAEDFRVVGVMPRGFDYPENYSEIWSPLVPHGQFRNNRRAHLLTVVADLRAGQTIGNAQAEIAAIGQRIEKQNKSDDPDMMFSTISLKKSIVAPVQPALLVLMFAVGLLLATACANLANLLLARGAAREKEFSLRTALGAGRGRLVRQLLTESIVLALLGAALGFGIATWSLQFISALASQDLPRFGEIVVDWRVLGFTLVISCLSVVLFGLAPAVSSTKTDLRTSLKEGPTSSGARPRGASRALIVPQFALAVVLLVGAGLLANSFVRLLRVNPGFRPEGVLSLQLFLSPTEYPERDPRTALVLQQMLERVRAIPGVRSAGLVTALPITGGASTDFVIEGRPLPPANDEPSADIRSVDSNYFRTMGIPLLAGREFTEADNAAANRVMVINETMARQYWPTESPIGQHVTMKDWGPPMTGEIVGVVGDVKARGLDEAVGSMIYWPYFQFPIIFNTIVARTDGDPSQFIPAVKAAVWAVNGKQPISRIETLEQILLESLARRGLYMILLGVFAIAALLLAAVGIYGMVSFSVSQRVREMGIRVAIGAKRADVLRLVVGQGTKVALLGIAVGIAAALGLTRLMISLLFGVSATDPLTFLGVAALLTLVALGASFLPALRATRVDPMVALRYE